MRRHLNKLFLFILLFNTVVFGASGTPSSLIVRVDANGYLVVTAATQTNPITQGVFSSRVLKTDSSGNLQVILAGTITPTYPLSIPASTCAAPSLGESGATTTGIAFTTAPSILKCITGNTIGTWDAVGLTLTNFTAQRGLTLKGNRPTLIWQDTTGVEGGSIDTLADPLTNTGLEIRTPGVTGSGGVSDDWTIFRFNGSNNKLYLGDTGSVSWIQSGHTPLNFAVNRTSAPTTAAIADFSIQSGQITSSHTDGASTGYKTECVATGALSGATVTVFTGAVPVSNLLGVTVRVLTTITGATSFSIGDGSDVDRWGANIALTANTTTSIANFTTTAPVYNTALSSIVLTANGSNFLSGTVRVCYHANLITASTQ